ncbi:MAG: type IV pilus assembly protein PilM [Candidatus Saccharimonadales bacterium]
MAIIKGVGDFFGLDISPTAVRVMQLTPAGHDRWGLKHYGYAPLDSKIAASDSAEARNRLGEVITTVVGQSGIKTKNVAIGLSSHKTFVTVVDMPILSDAELRGTIKYQIDQYVPMSMDEVKVDWVTLGQSLHDPLQQEVLLASTAIEYSEDRLEFVEGLGFDVIAAEPDSIAVTRALLPRGVSDARVIVDIGETSTNVVMTCGDTPRLVRTIPNGLATLVRAAVQNLSIEEDQAHQFITKFGLAKDKLEGQVAHALQNTLDGFVSEVTKSTKFFQTRYPHITIGGVIVSGYAGSIPKLDDYIGKATQLPVSAGNPWQYIDIPAGSKKPTELSAKFAVAIGLAQRGGRS